MKRRHLALAGTAALAVAGGVAWRVRREARDNGGGASLPPGWWERTVDRLDGTSTPLSAWRGTPLLINFWATWCPPCVREMPVIEAFAREQRPRGLRVLGLAADNRAPVQEFLRRTPASYDIAIAGMNGIELGRELGNIHGGLPFTALLDAQGRILKRRVGEISESILRGWVR